MPDRLRDSTPSAGNGWTVRLQAFPLRGLGIMAAVAALVLAANIPLARRNTQLLADHGSALIASYQVIARLSDVLSLAKDAETSTRGFVITGDTTYLAPFNAAQRDLPDALRRLDTLTKADATQQARISVLGTTLERHQAWLRETARVRTSEGLAAAEARVRSGAGKSQMDTMRALVTSMRAHEEGLLQGRSEKAAIAYRQVLRSGILAALGALLSFVALLMLAFRHFKARNAAVNEILDTQERLEESEHRLHAALRVAGMMAWDLDIPSGQLSLSDNATALLGLAEGQRLGDLATGLTLCHPADLAALQLALSASMETGEKLDIVCRIVRPIDGAIRWVHVRADVMRDEHQAPVRVLGMLLDITERRTAQDDVARLSALLHAINEATPDFVFTKDVDGRMTYANAATCRGLRKSLDELIGKTDLEFHENQEHARAIIANDRRVLRTGESLMFDEIADLPEGRRWFYSAKMPQRNAVGEIVGLIGVGRDITDRKRAEEALVESESRFRTLADNAPVMIWISDRTGAITYTNAQWKAFVDADEMAPADIARSLHSDDADAFRRMLAALPRQRGSVTLELRVCRADGNYRWVICTATPRLSETGAFLGGIGSLLDIEERKVLENDLRMLAADLSAADRRKDEFLATLAHELRNPLAPIRNGLEILRLALPANDTIDRTRGMMERQLVQIVRLVDDLLDISRISSGKLALQRSRVDLRDAITLAIEATSATRTSRSQRLVYDPLPDPVMVDGDLFRLGQVFTNLIDNAQKYSAPHALVWVSLHTDSTSVEVRVRDRGQGIPSNMLNEVFELFTQVDRSLERSQGGLGIGLTLVKRLIEMHGGTVSAHSDGADQGSEFSVCLPLVTAASRALPEHALRDRAGHEDARNILVADDNVDGAATLAMMLSARGHHVETANDGLSAVALGETMHPSLVLLDIGMPGLNGYEVCQRLRAMSWGEQATIVALTGWGQEHDRRRSADAGFDYHVVKPLDPSTLERILQRARAGVRPGPIA